MGDQLHDPFSSSCRIVLNILVISFSCVFLPPVSSGNAEPKILYVSKAFGNDTIVSGSSNNCQNSTLPCKTLSYVIDKSSLNDVIMVDSGNTALEPYDNCSSKPVQGSLSFKSWKGFAIINCSGHALVFEGSLIKGKVSFQGLKFINTFVQLTDVSLNVTNCTFGSFERNTSYLYIINISVYNLSSNITLTNSSFMKNNSAGCLKVVNSVRANVFLQIENSFILNNTPRFAPSLISIVGPLSFNFLNSEISNTTFSEYVIQPSAIKFSPNAAVNRANISQDETPSILSVRLSGGNFCGNGGKIIALFSHSARMMIINTNFSKNTDNYSDGGLMVLNAEDGAKLFDVHISNCWFDSNEKISYSNLIYIRIGDSVVSSNILLDTCHFNKNKNILRDAFKGTGSAVYVNGQKLLLNVSYCKFELNQAGAVAVNTSQYSNLYLSHTHVSCCSFWNDVPESYGAMISVIFNNSPNFPKSIELQEFNLLIEDCEFWNNTATMIGAGAVVVNSADAYLEHAQSVGKVTIRRSTFINNLAHLGTGALQISSNMDCNISDTVFRGNAGSEAGAIYFTGGSLLLHNCTIDSNYGGYTTSTFNGGSLRLIKQGSALIQNSRILQGEIDESFGQNLNFHGGVSLSSNEFGSINTSNSSFDFLWKPSTKRAIVMEITQTQLNLDNATFIRCPKSYNIKNITSASKYGHSFECYLCSMGTYSEDRGIYRLLSKPHHVKCLLCPYGAKCMEGLQALPNFWGYKVSDSNPPRIAFSRCPTGYCCQAERHRKSCFPYNTCNSQRQGRLCGKCKSGFTESLFTPSCRISKKCNDFWFWPVAVIFVLGFSLYLVIQPDFVSILWNKVTWFYHSSSQEIAPDDKVLNPGFERIVFFYYQATDILRVQVQSSYDVWDKFLSQFVLGLFNFEVRLNKEGFACPFPGLDPVSKVFFHSLGVISVLFAIPFIFMCHCLFCFCLRRDMPKTGSYLSAFSKGTMLGYAVLAAKSMKLLKCITVNGVNCLFINCNIQCYTWWQTLLGTSIVIYFIPFVLVLFFGSYKLFNKRISVLHFLLSFFLPLPFLSYWLINRRTLRNKHVPDSEGRDAITTLVIGSFRFPDHMNRGAIYWESVLIGRMLVLIIADVLIKEPLLRTLTLLFICILNLSFHIYIFPFDLSTANRAESLSLFCLVLLAMFNLPFMAYLSEGVVPTGPISHIMKVFSWCQAVLVAFLPCICAFIALAALLSQTVKLIFFISTSLRCVCCRVCCCRQCLLDTRDRDELVNPLITS